jgi:hypothetical protein
MKLKNGRKLLQVMVLLIFCAGQEMVLLCENIKYVNTY